MSKKSERTRKRWFSASSESLGVTGQPWHRDAAHAGHVRRWDLAHAARTRHPGADAPVLETAGQGRRARSGSFEESVVRSDRSDSRDTGSGQGGGGDGGRREQRVMDRRV